MLAVAGGALRSYLEDRDELPEQLAAGHGAGLGARGVEALRGRQQGLRAVHQARHRHRGPARAAARTWPTANRNAKEHHKAISADSLQDWAEFAAPRTFGLAVRAYAGLRLAEKHPVVHNLVISNVPGPPVPLYFMGARIEALYPLGPVFHGAGLNITVMSNNGQVHVGIIACRESMPDVDDLAQRFPAELAALKAAVAAQRPRPRSGARAKKVAAKEEPAALGAGAAGDAPRPGSRAGGR